MGEDGQSLMQLAEALATSQGQISRIERQRDVAAIAARADQQHQWVVQGDDRGIYGPACVELMRGHPP
jgi:hypothetical protein